MQIYNTYTHTYTHWLCHNNNNQKICTTNMLSIIHPAIFNIHIHLNTSRSPLPIQPSRKDTRPTNNKICSVHRTKMFMRSYFCNTTQHSSQHREKICLPQIESNRILSCYICTYAAYVFVRTFNIPETKAV